jgi:hypothetical protein
VKQREMGGGKKAAVVRGMRLERQATENGCGCSVDDEGEIGRAAGLMGSVQARKTEMNSVKSNDHSTAKKAYLYL